MAKNKTKKRSKQESLELTKTLVLNFNEVEKVAKYEKKTSKKPAVMIAVIGLFAIMTGLIYPSTSLNKKNNNSVSYRKTKIIKKLICTRNSNNIEEKINRNETITLNFKKNKLKDYNKTLVIKTTSSNLTETPKTITDTDTSINELKNNTISGYKLTVDKGKNKKIISKYNLKLKVNLKEFEESLLTDKHKESEFLNVKYKYKDNAFKIRDDLVKSGYTCN